jgi:hypothetical protein
MQYGVFHIFNSVTIDQPYVAVNYLVIDYVFLHVHMLTNLPTFAIYFRT